MKGKGWKYLVRGDWKQLVGEEEERKKMKKKNGRKLTADSKKI